MAFSIVNNIFHYFKSLLALEHDWKQAQRGKYHKQHNRLKVKGIRGGRELLQRRTRLDSDKRGWGDSKKGP